LDEGGDDVVVLLTRLVVAQRASLRGFLEQRQIECPRAARARHVRRDLERPERDPGIALRVLDEKRPGVGVEHEASAAEPALRIGERAVDERADLVGGERLENEDASARQERGDDLERGVLGRGADEDDRAALDVWQERVLLRLVEAMDLVDEEEDRLAGAAQL